ncbi:MAG: hypothetical protein EOO56_19910 [Hymenobacter sp.]|nr:MAG: hypothetical protein EOO56_19910 [Hymenobacter sp.]
MKKLLLLGFGLTMLGACKKDSEPAPSTSSRTDLLTAKSWRLTAKNTSITLPGLPPLTDNAIDACDQDNFLKFSTNKTVVSDEGATKCDPSDPQTQNGTWALKTNDTQLDITLSGGLVNNGTFDIKELSATTLHVYTSATNNGIAYTIDATFTAF